MTETFAYTQLQSGAREITIKPRGHSMEPLIRDREQVTIRRLLAAEDLSVGDIVLAKVRGHIYLHKVTALDGKRVQISNNHGHVNGWTSRDRVIGKLKKHGEFA